LFICHGFRLTPPPLSVGLGLGAASPQENFEI